VPKLGSFISSEIMGLRDCRQFSGLRSWKGEQLKNSTAIMSVVYRQLTDKYAVEWLLIPHNRILQLH
jgi:hypothetical protein